MLVHDCDLREGLHAKRWFDAVGHYGREDVLAPQAGPPAPPQADGGPADGAHRGTPAAPPGD